MSLENPINYCFMIRNGQPCIKTRVAEKHLPYHECEKCIWRIQSENPQHVNSLKRLYEKYGNKKWN